MTKRLLPFGRFRAARAPVVRYTPPGGTVSVPEQPKLDLGAKPKAPRKRGLTLKEAVPTEEERPVMRRGIKAFNEQLVDGGAYHIPNEGLISLLPEAARDAFNINRDRDGVLGGNTDKLVFQEMPERWRRILTEAGEKVPPLVALCMGIEYKAPGWTPDGRWLAGKQPAAHEWLRARGMPVEIAMASDEARVLAEKHGFRFRGRLLSSAAILGGVPPDQYVSKADRLIREFKTRKAVRETAKLVKEGRAPPSENE